ncbi:bidirectional sugar transporter SWEET1-like [Primulina huaijiensis]|uniref:bidirectional sugar transporter SWEET1-like n=1 Tax=Primulina huaijiensis TaxID=1492673 RepID=UPI003CC77BF5
MSKGHALHLAFGVFGNAAGLFLFLSPAITFKRIIARRSTEQFSGIPYVMALLNCLLAAWYGLPMISKDNLLVTIINGTGAIIETIYVLIFLIFAPKKERAKICGLFACVLVVFSVVASTSVLAFPHDWRVRKLLCGFAASVFSIVMYASPLSVMRMVVHTKSVEYMPFFLSLFVFLCGSSWFVYGLIGKDPFLFVPNGFGCALGTMQLMLYAIFRKNGRRRRVTEPSTDGSLDIPSMDGSVEMEMDDKPYQSV